MTWRQRNKPKPKKDYRRRYEGTATRCAWWDTEGGPCGERPKWQVTKDEGLCDEHDVLFYAKLREKPKQRERVEPVTTEEESDADKARRIVSARLKAGPEPKAHVLQLEEDFCCMCNKPRPGQLREVEYGLICMECDDKPKAWVEAKTQRTDGTDDSYPF